MTSARTTSNTTSPLMRYRAAAIGLLLVAGTGNALAAEAAAQRWYQIEMTVFTHETSNLELELWSPQRLSLGFPERMRTLRPVWDVLQLDDWSVLLADAPLAEASPEVSETSLVGPLPYAPAPAGEGFRLPDLQREAFWQLPASEHDFINTNRALTQSSQHRILFHAAWRQPMTRLSAATPVAVVGGRAFNDRHELEGSLRLYFNNSEDRIVLEPDLWLSSFRGGTESEWHLPPLPEILQPAEVQSADTPAGARSPQERYVPTRIIQVTQSREARSNEFHYIDHPALGVFIQLTPYEVPPLPEPPAPPLQPGAGSVAPPLELQ